MGEEAYLYRIYRDGTNWNAYGLENIWEMVRHESGSVSWQQYDAWRRMAEICQDQADQLDRAVAQLTERWPARPGSASEAFAAFMAELTGSMRQSAGAAVQARRAISDITVKLSITRGEIADLMAKAQRYAYDEQAMTPQPMPSPGQSPPPVRTDTTVAPPDGWRHQLANRARDAMAEADTAIGIHASSFQPFIQFQPPWDEVNVVDPTVGSPDSAGPGTSVRVPHIPLPPYLPPSMLGGPSTSAGDDVGPVLSGGATNPPTPPPVAGLPSASTQSGSPATHTGVPGMIPVIGAVGPGGVLRAPGSDAHGSGRAGGVQGTVTPAGAGGVGARAGTGGAHGPGMMPMPPMVPPAGGLRAGGTGSVAGGRVATVGSRHRATDPDDPWTVKAGGPGTLEPSSEPDTFDPGPGVIGLDR